MSEKMPENMPENRSNKIAPNRSKQRPKPGFSFSLFMLLLIAGLFGMQYMGAWHTSLFFDAQIIWQAPWRIITGHLIHLNWPHALLNFAGLAFVGLLFQRHFTPRSFSNAVITIAVIASLLVWLVGQPDAFVGLSAIIHGLLLMSLLHEGFPTRAPSADENVPATTAARPGLDKLTLLIIAAVVGKVVAEAFGITLTDGLIPAAAAGINQQVWILHGAGLVGGLLAWFLDKRSIRQLAQAEIKRESQNDA